MIHWLLVGILLAPVSHSNDPFCEGNLEQAAAKMGLRATGDGMQWNSLTRDELAGAASFYSPGIRDTLGAALDAELSLRLSSIDAEAWRDRFLYGRAGEWLGFIRALELPLPESDAVFREMRERGRINAIDDLPYEVTDGLSEEEWIAVGRRILRLAKISAYLAYLDELYRVVFRDDPELYALYAFNPYVYTLLAGEFQGGLPFDNHEVVGPHSQIATEWVILTKEDERSITAVAQAVMETKRDPSRMATVGFLIDQISSL